MTVFKNGTMGEYRVASDVTIHRRVIHVSNGYIHPALLRQDQVSLFDKYMPGLCSRPLIDPRQQLTRSNEDTLSATNMNEFRYVFWKDEAQHTIKDKEEEDEDGVEGGEHRVDTEDDDEEDEDHTIKQEVSFIQVETPVIHRKKEGGRDIPDESNTTVLSALSHSVLTGSRFRGTYYAFLMSHTVSGKKKDTNIGVSRYPLFSVIAHNNQARHNPDMVHDVYQFPIIYDKDTASAAPYWRLNTTLGPFFTKRAAEKCCHEWVKETRGTVSKQNKAYKLARLFQCDLYSSQTPIDRPIERYLIENNAPLSYIKACQALKRESHHIVMNSGTK